MKEGAKLATENEIDIILGVGGGSVMDCCKAVSLASSHKGDVWEDYWLKQGCIYFDLLPVGVIVTVTGSGSEMNGVAVISNNMTKVKTGRDYKQCNHGDGLAV